MAGLLRSLLLQAVSASSLITLLQPAAAAVLSGSFSGKAINSINYSVNPWPELPDFDGQPVSGTFRLDTSGLQVLDTDVPNSRSYLVPDGAVQMTFSLRGGTWSFGGMNDPGALVRTSLDTNGDFSIYFGTTDPHYNHHRANITLAGDLIDSLDITTLHQGSADLSRSSANAFDERYFSTGVRLDSLDVTVQAVPEPGTWLMLLGGLGVVACWRRRASMPA